MLILNVSWRHFWYANHGALNSTLWDTSGKAFVRYRDLNVKSLQLQRWNKKMRWCRSLPGGFSCREPLSPSGGGGPGGQKGAFFPPLFDEFYCYWFIPSTCSSPSRPIAFLLTSIPVGHRLFFKVHVDYVYFSF